MNDTVAYSEFYCCIKMAYDQSQMSTGGPCDTGSVIKLRVLAASTGVCYHISLHPNELR